MAYRNRRTSVMALKRANKKKKKKPMDDINKAFTAAKLNDVAALKSYQKDYCFDVNMQNSSGMTLLHLAASTLSEKTVDWLLSQPNIDPTLLDDFNRTAVTVAFECWDELADNLINKLNPHCYPWLYDSRDI